MTRSSRFVSSCSVVVFLAAAAVRGAEAPLDVVRFGDEASEAAHRLEATRSDTIVGGLSQPARQLLPLDPPGDFGGSVAFDVAVDPKKPTYFTIKLWGSDQGENRGRLLLFCEGKQVGIRHLGDVDSLDILSNTPRFPGRFTYTTTILPKAMTAGKTSLRVEVRSLGRMWGYGATWDKFQKPMAEASRGLYAAYTHTDPYLQPPADEVQGAKLLDPPARAEPGAEVIDEIKLRVNTQIQKLLAASTLDQMQLQFLARAYHVKWTPAYQQAKTIEQVLKGLDGLYVQFKANPKLAELDPRTPNPDWFGFGPAGDAVRRLAEQIRPTLNDPINAAGNITRRDAYAEMFVASREWHRRNRRLYTNQTMIKDLYGIYLANRGLQVVAPDKAMPESDARRYLYESVGLQPWLGNDKPEGGSVMPMGPSYMQLTDKGLTKELGYVGSYGEVLDWVTAIYDATRPTLAEEGDARIRAKLVKIAKARAAFRHPLLDETGGRTMVLESVVGWRDTHHPGYIAYAQRPTRDAGPFEAAVATMDPALLGYSQQMLDDNQFFSAMRGVMQETNLRVTAGLLDTPDAYEIVKSQPPIAQRLPMSPGQEDFIFSDEENGVVAIKHGDEILYASLYWRARFGINSLARVHHLTPTIERDATVWEDVQFDDSGLTYTRDDRVVEAQTRRHEKSRGDIAQAFEGEVMPIAKVPDGINFKPGQENIHAGKGTFYTLRYGPYLITMNMTTDRTFSTNAPAEESINLASKQRIAAGTAVRVGPRQTIVLRIPDATSPR